MCLLERDAKPQGLPQTISVKDATKGKTTFIYYDTNRPSSIFHDTTWCTGIFPESELVTEWRQEVASRSSLPLDDFQAFVPESPIFVDGSCFHHSWAPSRSAAAAVVSKCGCSKVYLLAKP